jgi:hypothetical protein
MKAPMLPAAPWLAFRARKHRTLAARPNPKFRECQEKRTSDIGKMLSDGVIDQAKHDEFLARAIQTCAGMFPPEG